jgi:filamentous hemagglutinin family protein
MTCLEPGSVQYGDASLMHVQNASWRRHANRPLAAAATALWCTVATASPEGGTFIHGDGSITSYGGGVVTVVELLGPDRFVVGWNDFDVAAGETVTFNGVDFTVLNTINTGAPSTTWAIDGTVNAPGGDVWFVNPAGVMFGASSVLDVGGLLAAAGTVNTADFVAGNDLFNLTGDVSFAGTMSTANGFADRVVLLGHHVDNTGLLQGNVIAMASGDTIRLIDLGTRITLEIDGTLMNGATAAAGTQASMNGVALVSNHGRIETSNAGQVLLASGDALGAMLGGLAIEHDGEIVSAGGTVELLALDGTVRTDQSWAGGNAFVANAGLISTSSESGGGDVTLAGPAVVIGGAIRSQGGSGDGGGTVAVRASGSIVLAGNDIAGWNNSAAGHAGTGSISVVGGSGAHSGGTITLDAGDGRVIGSAFGGLTAVGGLTGGNGGDVDVRGGELQWNTRVRASAVNGSAGSVAYASTHALRITDDGSAAEADFNDLLAGASGDAFLGAQLSQALGYVDSNISVASGDRLTFETSIAGLPNGGPTRLTGDAIFSGTDIVLADTTGRTELQAGGELALLGEITMQNSDAVLLAGQRDGVSGTELGGSIRATGTYRGNLDLSSPGGVHINGDIGADGGEIGSLILRSVGDLEFIGTSHTIHAQRDVTFASIDGGDLAVSLMGDLSVQADGDIVFGDRLTITGNESLSAIAGGHLDNRAVADIAGDLTFIGGTLGNHKAITVGGDLVLGATSGTLQTNHALLVAGSIGITGKNGVALNAQVEAGGSVDIASSGGDVSIDGALNAGGALAISAQGGIQSTAVISVQGAEAERSIISVESGGDIALGGALLALGHDVVLQAGGSLQATQIEATTLTATAGGNSSFGILSVTSDVVSESVGDLTLAGNVEAGGLAFSALSITQIAGTTLQQFGEGTLELQATDDIVLAGDVLGGEVLSVNAGNNLTIGGQASASRVGIQAGNTLVLDGAAIASHDSGVIGGVSLHIEAPTINVVNDSTVVAAAGELVVVGVEADASTLANVQLLDAALHIETDYGPLVFLATADGNGDLSLESTAGVLYVGGDLGSTSALASISLEGANGVQLGGLVPLESSAEQFDVHTIHAQGDISLQIEDLNAIPEGIATILGFSDAMSITSDDGDIRIGNNQGFVQLGDLAMQASGGVYATDITALGDLVIAASSLHVHKREPMELVDSDGSLVTSPQSSFVAGGDVLVNVGAIIETGPGGSPLFGALGVVTGVPDDQLATPMAFGRDDLVFGGHGGTTSLLLQWLEATDPEDPTLIAAESQSTQVTPEVVLLEANDDLVTEEALSEMGIVLRPLETSKGNTTRLARPGEVTVDLVSGPGPAQVGRVVVTRTRLLRSQVQLAVDGWRSAWADGAGTKALGVARPAAITSAPAQQLTVARAQATSDALALGQLRQKLQATYRHLSLAGLTPSELQASKQYVINSLIAQGAPVDAAVAALR